MLQIKLFSKPTGCGRCKAVKRLLDNKQIHYDDIPYNQDTQDEFSKRNITSVPVTILYDTETGEDLEIATGFRKEKIESFIDTVYSQ